MTAAPPRRPWYRRKRTWAALAVWLAVAYLAGSGPVAYLYGRGWLSPTVAEHYLLPVGAVLNAIQEAAMAVSDYVAWCLELGQRHAASD